MVTAKEIQSTSASTDQFLIQEVDESFNFPNSKLQCLQSGPLTSFTTIAKVIMICV